MDGARALHTVAKQESTYTLLRDGIAFVVDRKNRSGDFWISGW